MSCYKCMYQKITSKKYPIYLPQQGEDSFSQVLDKFENQLAEADKYQKSIFEDRYDTIMKEKYAKIRKAKQSLNRTMTKDNALEYIASDKDAIISRADIQKILKHYNYELTHDEEN